MPPEEIENSPPVPEESIPQGGETVEPQQEPELTQEEIAQAEAELKELEELRQFKANLPQGTPFNADALAQALSQAITPLIPKPPSPAKAYDDESMITTDFKTFRSALGELIKDQLASFKDSEVASLLKELNEIKGILPQLYLRSAENPQYGEIDKRARDISSKYNIPYWQATQIAKDQMSEIAKSSVATNTVRQIPKHMSAPDNRATNLAGDDDSKGALDFKDIVKGIRAKHGNNL